MDEKDFLGELKYGKKKYARRKNLDLCMKAIRENDDEAAEKVLFNLVTELAKDEGKD